MRQRWWLLGLLAALLGWWAWGTGGAQVPTPGTRLHAAKQSVLIVDDLILDEQGGPGYVLYQQQPSGRVTAAPIGTSQLTDGAALAHLVGPQILEQTRLKPRACAAADTGSVAITYTTCNLVSLAAMTQATAFANPTGTPYDRDVLIIRACAATAQTVTWGTQYEASFGIPLPTATSGSNYCDLWGWSWNADTSKWGFMASTQGGRSGYIYLNPLSAKLPAANAATIDNSNPRPQILFDNTTPQCVNWSTVVPDDYVGTPTITLVYRMPAVTTGSVFWDVSVMVCAEGVGNCQTDDYAAVNNLDDTAVPGTVGSNRSLSGPLTTNDSMEPGKLTIVRLCRDIADTAAGLAAYVGGWVKYAR